MLILSENYNVISASTHADKMLKMMGEEVGMAAFLAASQMHSKDSSPERYIKPRPSLADLNDY